MNKYLFTFGLCFLFRVAVAQDLPIHQVTLSTSDSTSVRLESTDGILIPLALADSLPPIYMRVMPSRIILSLASLFLPIVPGTGLFLGWHAYTIEGRIRFTPKAVKPYFLATQDQRLLDLYQRHRNNRTVWYTATAGGVVVGAIGFAQLFVSIFRPANLSAATTKLIIGGGLLGGGQIARVVSFRQLRKAVNLYNDQYAVPPKRVSLHVGLSSQTPAGGALYLRF
ncbi:hypothetical protein [Telluribacter sp. SYSU D00476]|uniref:hypothetical protein n=1 Tax=Telluribacter sp. SYSU D00476 TaxID=2811430 RepID=UPI001FF34DC0|nr:hypothetical protein [Telluribacter sp. SYSU D00476]